MVRKGEVSYDFDDLKALLNLQCGVDQSGKDGSAPNGASLGASGGPGDVPLSGGTDRNRRQYNEFLIVRGKALAFVDRRLHFSRCRSSSLSTRRAAWRTTSALSVLLSLAKPVATVQAIPFHLSVLCTVCRPRSSCLLSPLPVRKFLVARPTCASSPSVGSATQSRACSC